MRNVIGSLLLIALTCAASAAMAHAKLERSDPAAGSTVAPAPSTVTLTFTEKLEPKFSGAEVHDASGARVDKSVSVSGNAMQVSVGALQPGTYGVNWHALSVDTHKTQGSFSFSVGK